MLDARQAAAWCGGEWTRVPEHSLTAVTQDTRALPRGALFVALPGEHRDGHDFVAAAFAAGAGGALVRRDRAADCSAAGPLLLVDDPLRALTALAAGRRARWNGIAIGITGSVGKTTVKELLADGLARRAPTARNPGNWNNHIGLPLSLLRLESAQRYGVFELGMNHPGELAPLAALLQPRHAVLTRVGPVHIEHFPSEIAIAVEKAELLRALPPSGWAVLAADEPWFAELAAAAPCRVVTVALDGAADFMGAREPDGALLVREPDGARERYALSAPGEPLRRNALRAIAAARLLDVPAADIRAALADFRLPEQRGGETELDGVRWINDAYNANPISLRAALETLAARPVAGRRWAALGGMHELGDREAAAHEELGRFAADLPLAGIVALGAKARRLAAAANERRPGCAVAAADAAAAAAWLRERIRPGDAVLLKGSRAERVEDVLEKMRDEA